MPTQKPAVNHGVDPSLSKEKTVNSDKPKPRRYPKRMAEARLNIKYAMSKAPIQSFGTLTHTFPKNMDAKEASRRLNNFKRRELPKIFPRGYVQIIEAHADGKLHLHTLGNCGCDILTGFNVDRYLSDKEISRKLRGGQRKVALRRSRNKFGLLTKNPHHQALLKRLRDAAPTYALAGHN